MIAVQIKCIGNLSIRNSNTSLWESLKSELRQDILPILLYILVLFVLTYPLVLQLGEIIPLRNMDTYTAIWQNWWMKESISLGKSSLEVDVLFHPDGLNTEIQPRRWVTFPLWIVLFSVFGEPSAYNITVLIQALLRAYAMYRFILLFVPHRPSAWIGGAVFAYSAQALSYGIQQPQVGSVEFLPIFMIVWVSAIRSFVLHPTNTRRGLLLMLLAGICYALNIYQSTTVGILAMLLGGIYLGWQLIWHQLWRRLTLWLSLVLFGVTCIILTVPIIYPIITSENLNNAIDQYTPSKGLDMMLYLQMDLKSPIYYNQWISNLNGRTIAPQPHTGFAKLSLMSLAITLVGIIYMIRHHRKHIIWVIITFFFFLLSLGTTITVNNTVISEWSPYHLFLDNPLFVIIREPNRFQILMLFGYALVVAFGLYFLSQKVKNQKVQTILWMIITMVILFETSIAPIPSRPNQLSPAYEYIMEVGEDGAIIDMPMHRQASKVYMYSQVFHQRPIVEGMTGRMPPDAYAYIQANLFLDTILRRGEIETLDEDLVENWESVIQNLMDDGFRYVVVHHDEHDGIYHIRLPDEFLNLLLPDVEPLFSSARSSVYDLYDIQQATPK